MAQKILNYIYIILLIILIGGVFYVVKIKKPQQTNTNQNSATTTQNHPTISTIEYKNTEYGFSFILPKSWKGYTIIEDQWDGITEQGPLISIRHPDWDYKAPRQDIPIMVFTVKQWNLMQADKFHVGAAPINPSEIGRNTKYVFAIPARYNYAYLVGFEEVDEIIKSNMQLKTF